MPLPKTATIAARATEVYCEVWSVILQRLSKMPPTRTSDLNELSQLLPYLRQLLTCCACAGLLDNAMISLTCGHCYCFECQFREPLLKIQCRQCRERNGLVMESQLQLVVKCYKHMCFILGEELRRNPAALGVAVVKSEPKEPTTLNAGSKNSVGDKEKSELINISVPKESVIMSKKKVVIDPDFDPIAEIVREVEKGMKVSRATLIVKPPSKYLSTKVAVTPKKEKEPAVSTKSVTATPPPPKVSSACEEETQPLSSVSKITKTVKGVKGEKKVSTRPANLVKMTNLKMHKRKPAQKEAHCNETTNSRNRTRKSQLLSSDTSKTNHHNQHSIKKKKAKGTTDSKMTEFLTESSTCEESIGVKGKSQKPTLFEGLKPPVNSQPVQSATFNSSQITKNSLAVLPDCFDSSYLKITSKTVSLLPHEKPAALLTQALTQLSSLSSKDATTRKKTSFVRGEWRSAIRKRKWGPLCPSVVVKRPREDIAKMVLLQSKVAKGKRRARLKAQQRQKQFTELSTSSNKTHSPSSARRLSRKAPPPSLSLPPPPLAPLPHPPTSSHVHPPGGDMPLPEDIPILPSDGSQDLLDDDIDWQELSDFLESNDEESMSTLPPPLGLYGHHRPPPPPLPPHPHHRHHLPGNPGLDPIHFDEYGPPRHLIHPPYMPPHGPRHHHHPHMLPPSPHPLTPHGPHTPVMPFPLTMRPPHPDLPPHNGFFPPRPPMMGPEDFLPGGGIGLPNRGGFSGHMGSYPANGLCPERAYQHSPGPHPPHNHHHLGGHFTMPGPRIAFTPPGPRRNFPGPLVLHKQKNRGSNMSGMVKKMKIKSPGEPPLPLPLPPQKEKILSPPSSAAVSQGKQAILEKKRRSPGYSEAGWRCRCGTNNVMFPDKVCAKGKCPCYTKGIACKNCLCRHCHNPFGVREISASSPADASISE